MIQRDDGRMSAEEIETTLNPDFGEERANDEPAMMVDVEGSRARSICC